jgi:hypothetical protein
VGISYPLGNPGTEKIDERLLGTWIAQTEDAEMKKLVISKKDAYTYRVQVLEPGEMYALETDWLDAWVTQFEGYSFVYGKPDDDPEENYYLYQYAFEGNTLVTQDVSLLVGGMDAVTSPDTYKEEVRESLKLPDCLTSRMEYVKE